MLFGMTNTGRIWNNPMVRIRWTGWVKSVVQGLRPAARGLLLYRHAPLGNFSEGPQDAGIGVAGRRHQGGVKSPLGRTCPARPHPASLIIKSAARFKRPAACGLKGTP